MLFDRQNSICVGVAAWVEGLMRKKKKPTKTNGRIHMHGSTYQLIHLQLPLIRKEPPQRNSQYSLKQDYFFRKFKRFLKHTNTKQYLKALTLCEFCFAFFKDLNKIKL